MRWIFMLFLLPISSAQAQIFDQLIRPMVTLSDRETIELILNELLILPPDSLTTMNMVDVTANGYGVDDLIILNPSGQVHHLDAYTPPVLQQLMATWSFEADYRYEALRSETPTALLSAHTSQDAINAIAGSCVNAIASHYEGDEMNLLLSQSQGTVRLEMWNYDPLAMSYGGVGESMSCEINRQRFEFARPITVTTFRDRDSCVEAWGEKGEVRTRRCSN